MNLKLTILLAIITLPGCADNSAPSAPEQKTASALDSSVTPDPILQNAVQTAVSDSDTRLRIGLFRVELESTADMERRLNRLGARWNYIPANLPLEELRKFDVVCFSTGWGQLDGIAGLRETYLEYLKAGGGMMFASPDVDGDADNRPALTLLPHSVNLRRYARSGGAESVIVYAPGKPHPLAYDVKKTDLPYPRGHINQLSEDWTVISKTSGEDSTPTVLISNVGKGRVTFHLGYDDYGHNYNLSDRFVVRLLKWTASEADKDVTTWAQKFGPRQFSPLVLELKRDYERLIANVPAQVKKNLEKADRLLRFDAQQGSTWTAYNEAVQLIRSSRSKAAIPLFLILLLDEDVNHNNFKSEVLQSFRILTGEEIGEDPEVVAREWWCNYRDQLTVSIDDMTQTQRIAVVEELLKVVSHVEPMGMGRTPPLRAGTVESLLKGGYRVYASDYRSSLHPLLVPILLAQAERSETRWLVPGPLAAIHSLGIVRDLPKRIDDPQTSLAQQVMIACALYRAEVEVPAKSLVLLWKQAEEMDLRQALIMLLVHHKDPVAEEIVAAALFSEHASLREMARNNIRQYGRGAHTSKMVRRTLEFVKDGGDLQHVCDVLEYMQDRRAGQVLVDLLRQFQKQGDSRHQELTLKTLISNSGRAFGEPADSLDRKTKAAIAWWESDSENR